jgi:hypothetical protein
MKAKVLTTLLLSAIATPALAGDAIESMFVGPAIQIAQLAPEELRQWRERWRQASPEDRMTMRRQFEEQLRQLPPGQRQRTRDQWSARIPNPPDPAGMAATVGGFVSNFGTGFEQRRPDPSGPDDNAANFDPRDPYNPSAGRYRR